MKGSGVVLGLKSFLDKIHPQLPLTTKESQRLLTALTSSFRKHLDEAHPTSVEDERKPKVAIDAVAKPQVRTWHSSASYADKHLASVLTNPLLVKGGKRIDHASAKVEFAKNPTKDPIELLEEYHEQHAATVPIAQLCLEQFMNRLKILRPEKQEELIHKHAAGRRVLLWLLENKLTESISFVDNEDFKKLLVYFLLREGREQNIWDWMKLDIRLEPQQTVDKQHARKLRFSSYRWRGRILHALVANKLGSNPFGRHSELKRANLDDALDAFATACEIQKAAPPNHHLGSMCLGAAQAAISKAITGRLEPRNKRIDPRRLEKYMSYLPMAFEGNPKVFIDMVVAQLYLIHPEKCTATPAYNLFRNVFTDVSSKYAESMVKRIRDSHTNSQQQKFFMMMNLIISVLRAEGRTDEASWMDSLCRREFPQLARHVDGNVEMFSRQLMESDTRADEAEVEQEEARLPFPTFI